MIAPASLISFITALFEVQGFGADESRLVAEHLVDAELCGHASHGLQRVQEYLRAHERGKLMAQADLTITHEGANSLQAGAGRGLGQAMMPRFLELLYAKLDAGQAVVAGGLHDCGHIGRLGAWVEQIAVRGFIGLVVNNDNGAYVCVAPPGGREARVSTDPVAFGLPTRDGTFWIDLATSAVAAGKVRRAQLAGEEVAPGLLLDAKGHPTTDPAALFAKPPGTIRPMGGDQDYKGFALAMMVDLLVAGLSGGHAPPAPEGAIATNSVAITLWNLAAFGGIEELKDKASAYLEYLRSSTPIGDVEIRLPGDNSARKRKEAAAKGISLAPNVARYLAELAAKRHIPVPAGIV